MIVNVEFSEAEDFTVDMYENEMFFLTKIREERSLMSVEFDAAYVGDDTDPYIGPYSITPSFETQSLDTDNLKMTEDLIIEKIPVAEVSNPAGGITVIVG